MIRIDRLLLVASALVLGACGGTPDLTCDEEQFYQTAVITDRVESPEGLDQLDRNLEMPLPEASPRPPREPGQPCVDRPPEVRLGS